MLHIQNHEDIINARIFLINYIWGSDALPYNIMPNEIKQNIFDERFSDLTNLKQIDKISDIISEIKDQIHSIFEKDNIELYKILVTITAELYSIRVRFEKFNRSSIVFKFNFY